MESMVTVSDPVTEASTQFHLARPVAPMGQGCIAISPTEVQSHWSFRDVTGGHDDVIDGAIRLSFPVESRSEAGDEMNDLPEKIK